MSQIDADAEKNFLLLKKRLDSLHYCQPLTIESAALAKRLLNDLIKTTEGFQKVSKENVEFQKKVAAAEQSLEPLKRENAKLIKENNELHYSMIKVKEDSEFANNRWKTTFNALEGEKNDIKFVLEQKEQKIKKVEDENLSLKSKLDTLMSKVYIPSTQGGLENLPPSYNMANISAPTNISLSKKGMQFEMNKPAASNEMGEYNAQRDQEARNWADQVRTLDTRILELTREMRGYEENKSLLQEKIKHMQVQIQNRESEIQRLHTKIGMGNVNVEKISKDYELDQQVEKVDRLNHQIDFLSKENHQLETELSSLKSDMKRIAIIKEEGRQQSEKVFELSKKLEEAQSVIKQHDQKRQQLKSTFEEQLGQVQQIQEGQVQQKENLAKQIRELQEHIDHLKEQNDQLKIEASKSNQVVQAYQSDKRVFSQAVEKVKNEKEDAFQKVESLIAELNGKQSLLIQKEEEKQQIQNRVMQLERELQLMNQNELRLYNENKQQVEDQSKLKQQIQQLEQQILHLNSTTKDTQYECEKVSRQKQQVFDQTEKLKNECALYKQELDSLQQQKDKLERQLDQSSKDITIQKRDINNLEQILGSTKRQYQEEQDKSREYYNQIKLLQDKVKDLEQQLLSNNEIIDVKIKQTRQAESERVDLQRENFQLAQLKRKYEEQSERLLQLQQQNNELEEKRGKYYRELESIRFDVLDKSQAISTLEGQLQNERDQRIALIQELAEKQQQSVNTTETFKLKQESLNHQTVLELELEKVRDRERKLLVDVLNLQTEVKKNENLIIQGSKQVEYLNNQKDEQIKEIKELRKELNATKNSKEETINELITFKEKVNQMQLEIHEQSDNSQKLNRNTLTVQNELTVANNKVKDLSNKVNELENQNKQLKLISEGLERVREELLERLQNKNSDIIQEEQEKSRYQKEQLQLNNKISELQQQLKKTKDSLVQIDEERDHIQNILDKATEENIALKEQLEHQQLNVDKLKDTKNTLTSKQDQNIQRVLQLEQQTKDSNKKIQQLLQELDNIKYALAVKDKELIELANDLNVVTRQNQNLTEELLSNVQQLEQVKQQLNISLVEDKKQKQLLRAQDLDKQDLLSQYQSVCLDNEKIEKHAQDLVNENQALFRKAQDFEKEYNLMHQHLQHQEVKEGQMINDLQNMERQITFLNQKLETADQHIRDINNEKENMHRQYQSMVRVSQGLEGNQGELQKSLMALENEKNSLLESLNLQKREIDAKTSQLDYERSRASQLEEVLMRERQVQYKQAIESQEAQQERDHLFRQLEDLKSQNMSLQSMVHQENERSGGYQSAEKDSRIVAMLEKKVEEKNQLIKSLETEQRAMREENSKLRLNMYRFESEKNDLEKRMNSLKESQVSDRSHESDQQINQEGWERLQAESLNFKKSLNEASYKGQALHQNAKNLRKEYDQVIPPSSTKSRRSNQ